MIFKYNLGIVITSWRYIHRLIFLGKSKFLKLGLTKLMSWVDGDSSTKIPMSGEKETLESDASMPGKRR